MEAILKHRSIRKFKNTEISKSVLNQILVAGSRASTTGNMQVYSIIVTKEEEMRKKLWEVHFKQNMVLEAPVILTVCADFNRFNKWCELRDAVPGYDNFLSFYTASIDALLAAQNICIAAEDEGLGICYLGTTTYMSHKIVDILELPQSVVPVTTIALGYPDEEPELTDRLPMEAIVHYEKYNEFTSQAIDEIYAPRENLESTKQLIAENKKETLAQVFADNRYKKEDNVTFSKLFLETIKNQGFMNNE